MKRIFYSEAAYIVGLALLAVGTALMEKADFGMSMIVAPAYILHLKVSESLPFYSFGMAEYTIQALLIIVLIIIRRRFRLLYAFSFVTAILYGLLLDCSIFFLSSLPEAYLPIRIIYYTVGILFCTLGVALLFQTYISPEAYELFVKELSGTYHISLQKFKTCYDCLSLLISIILSFLFFGLWEFRGVEIGTLLSALINGTLISFFARRLNGLFVFSDKFAFRKYFE